MPIETDVKREISKLNSRIEHLEIKVEELTKRLDKHTYRYTHAPSFMDFDNMKRILNMRIDMLEARLAAVWR